MGSTSAATGSTGVAVQTPSPGGLETDGPRASPSAGSGSPSDHVDDAEAGATDDDLRVFAFATTDEAALAAELGVLAATVATLESDLQARDLDAAERHARTLLDQAEVLGTDAHAATDRQRPLEPADPYLVAARGDAIDAFGTTAEYADSVTDIAEAVLSGELSDLPALLREAADLAGTSDDLLQSSAHLNAELVAWADANPADAARALARYGAEQ
jgi:hypothetical protein